MRELFTEAYRELLLDLLRTPTISPLETGCDTVVTAQRRYADHAAGVGFTAVLHHPVESSALYDSCVPLTVREAAARMGDQFLAIQPNLVLRLGPPRAPERTLMFNFHMDTVSGSPPVAFRNERFAGRGAVDMKGPGVALLAGIDEALRRAPSLAAEISVVIQCVAGEEGGAMGVYGSRVLADQGYLGRLNIFAEPSDNLYFDRSTSSMTARMTIDGEGATDDAPHAGENATLALGYIAQYLGKHLAGPVEALGGKICIAGLHTGAMHNRVYGTGTLLCNLAYGSTAAGQAIGRLTEACFADACQQFTTEFAEVPVASRTARHISEIGRLTWLKRDLPVLSNRDAVMEQLLAGVGLERNPDDRPERTFTCDAMWAQRPDCYTIVYGPGDLARNGAHTDAEYISLQELEAYAQSIAAIVTAFGAHVASLPAEGVKL